MIQTILYESHIPHELTSLYVATSLHAKLSFLDPKCNRGCKLKAVAPWKKTDRTKNVSPIFFFFFFFCCNAAECGHLGFVLGENADYAFREASDGRKDIGVKSLLQADRSILQPCPPTAPDLPRLELDPAHRTQPEFTSSFFVSLTVFFMLSMETNFVENSVGEASIIALFPFSESHEEHFMQEQLQVRQA